MELDGVVLTDVTGAFTVCSPRGRFEQMKDRVAYGLSLCRSGRITYLQNGREVVSDESVAVLLPKGGSYYIKGDRDGYFPVINFECAYPIGDEITAIPIRRDEELYADFDTLRRLVETGGNRHRALSILYGMLDKLTRPKEPAELAPALRLIRAEYCDPTLDNRRLAGACSISEVYFRRLFTQAFGQSPKQMVIDLRLGRARRLLAEGVLSISGVAEACGFAGQYYFCRLFKERMGKTPSQYRRDNLITGI